MKPERIQTRWSLIGAGIFVICLICGTVIFKSCHQLPAPAVIQEDTLRFQVQALEAELTYEKARRAALQHDTAVIYSKYEDLLARIRNAKTDSAQRVITREIVDKPDPTLADINEKLAEGKKCCELADNQRQQLRSCDSSGRVQDSIISTEKVRIARASDRLTTEINKSADLEKKLEGKTRKLKGWRKTAIAQGIAILATGTLIFLSQ
jgi:hypothetical protein